MIHQLWDDLIIHIESIYQTQSIMVDYFLLNKFVKGIFFIKNYSEI